MIKVKPEGRDGVWLPDEDSLIAYIGELDEPIHNFIVSSTTFIGADWPKDGVIRFIQQADKLGLLTGESFRVNMHHALSVIKDEQLYMFDIGEINEADLETT